jgi:ABC-type multidrug transport system fused ATPase/permease subunit
MCNSELQAARSNLHLHCSLYTSNCLHVQAKVSLERIEDYLNRDEIEGNHLLQPQQHNAEHYSTINSMLSAAINSTTTNSSSGGAMPVGVVSVRSASFQWSAPPLSSDTPTAGTIAGATTSTSAVDTDSASASASDGILTPPHSPSSIALAVEQHTPHRHDTGATTTTVALKDGSSGDSSNTKKRATTGPTLRNINLDAQPGQLVCIYGTTGKSYMHSNDWYCGAGLKCERMYACLLQPATCRAL